MEGEGEGEQQIATTATTTTAPCRIRLRRRDTRVHPWVGYFFPREDMACHGRVCRGKSWEMERQQQPFISSTSCLQFFYEWFLNPVNIFYLYIWNEK